MSKFTIVIESEGSLLRFSLTKNGHPVISGQDTDLHLILRSVSDQIRAALTPPPPPPPLNEWHNVTPQDSQRIECSDCGAPATRCEHNEFSVNGRKGISFFYYCATCENKRLLRKSQV